MADGKVIFEIHASAKGVKVVQQQTDKLAKSSDSADKSTKKLTKSRDAYHRREKGAAQISSNSTKNFSKMQQGIDGGGGSGGLVRAYALLAANVFALTAAFGVLSRSAQIDTLTKSMEILSTTGGTYIKTLAMDMREASGGAIDLAQSFRQVSLATSAGLNVKEIEGLTQVAKGAALSLGRDLPDAMDRIFRGAIKLEPEILDEIGLFVRVDEAAEKYARQLGKSASALSQAEKRQGFLNEILDQGTRKFQAYAEEVKPDPYVKIAAALSDVAQSALSMVNKAFGPLIGFLAESKGLLTLVFGAVVFSLLRMAVPAIGQFNQGLAESAKKAADNAKEYSKGISDTTKAQIAEDNKKVKSALKAQQKINRARTPLSLKVGGKKASSKLEADLQNKEIKGEERLEKVKKRIEDLEKKQGLRQRQQIEGYDEELAALKRELAIEKEITDLRTREGKAKTVSDPGTVADKRQQSLDQRAMTTGALASVTGTAETKGMGAAWDELKDKLKNGEKQADGTKKKFKGLNKGMFALRGGFGIAAVGAQGLMMSLGPIMMIIGMVMPLLIGFAKWLGFMSEESKAATESIDKLNQVTDKLGERMKSQTDQMKSGELGFTEQAKAAAAFSKGLQDVATRVKDVGDNLDNFLREGSDLAVGWDSFIGFISFGNWGVQANANLAIVEGAAESLAGSIRAGEEDLVNMFAAQLDGSDEFIAATKAQIAEEEKHKKIMEEIHNEDTKLSRNQIAAINSVAKARELAEKWRNIDPAKADAFERVAQARLEALPEAHRAAANSAGDLAVATLKTSQAQRKLSGDTNDLRDSIEDANLVIDGVASGPMSKYDDQVQGLSSALEGARESMGKFSATFVTTTKIDEMSASFSQLSDKLITTKDDIDTFNEAFAKDLGTNDQNPLASLFTDKEKEILAKGGDAALKVWRKAEQEVKAYQKTLITLKTDQKALNDLIKKFGEVGTINDKLFKDQAKKQTELAQVNLNAANLALANRLRNKQMDEKDLDAMGQKIAGLETEAEKEAALVGTGMTLTEFYGAQADHHAAISARMAEEVASLTESERANIQITKAAQAQVQAKKQLNTALQTEAKLTAQIAQAMMTGSTKLTPQAEAKLSVQAAIDAYNITKEEVTLKMAMLDYEMTIQQVKLEVLAKQANEDFGQRRIVGDDGKVKQEATGLFATLDNAQTTTREALNKTLETADEVLVVAVSNAVSSGFKGGISSGIAATNDAIAAISGNEKLSDDEKKQGARLVQMTALRETTNKLAEDMKKLGPEGEATAAVVQGGLAIIDAYSTLDSVLSATGDNAATFGEKVAAGFEFAAQALGQINNMMAAQSRAAIAVVDKQIEAEKKRDGKSSESINKIKAMEKKKEAMKKKAFEQDKKMKMAQTVASTAAGMIGVFAGVKDPLFSMSLAVAQAAIIGAMGAASLAMIAKTSYQGGGGSIDAPKPQALSIGKRDNKVDVSRGVSGGELAYMRGQRGVGSNANDFRPTGGAYGMRNYAYQGEGIIVGEQGPEVVTPTQPVDVLPMRGTGEHNVNFTINAIDAEGVESVLERQRGNIIGMIRGAANGYGTGFLEEVDTDVVGNLTGASWSKV